MDVIEVIRSTNTPTVVSIIGGIPSPPEIVEAGSLEEETAAFLAGAKIVIRTDLL